MPDPLRSFESIVRRAHRFSEAPAAGTADAHPFTDRNIHPDFPADVRRLFDNGHYAQATFEAFKYLDEEVQRLASSTDFGRSLMMSAFGGSPPPLKLNPGVTVSDTNEQDGYKFIFAGSAQGIRNPRGHATSVKDDPDTCLDHLSLASMLLRKLEQAGLR